MLYQSFKFYKAFYSWISETTTFSICFPGDRRVFLDFLFNLAVGYFVAFWNKPYYKDTVNLFAILIKAIEL